jgi:hypothetical protein
VAKDIVPADPRAQRIAIAVLLAAALLGTPVVWWLSGYLDRLGELARTDRDAAIALFRSRVLPVFILLVLVGVAAGVLLLRQGLQVLRAGAFPPPGWRTVHDTPVRTGGAAKAVGVLMAAAGFLTGAIPLAILAAMLWLLARA